MTVFLGRPDLLRRFRHGEEAALTTVYRTYVGRLTAVVERRFLRLWQSDSAVRLRGRPEASDLVQEVFAHAFCESARNAYDEQRTYYPLLLGLARNLLTDWLRRRSREVVFDAEALERVGDDAIGNADPLLGVEAVGVVRRFVSTLPPLAQAVYVERYSRDRSQTEAAAELNISRQQLRTLEQRIRRGLQRELMLASLREPNTQLRNKALGR